MTGPSGNNTALYSLEEFLATSYDYIIVGGGTAGLVVAARLTEDPNVKVGVIEAGKDERANPLVATPALFAQMVGWPEYDWMLKTVPQKGNQNRVHAQCRGKMLGGSSAINAHHTSQSTSDSGTQNRTSEDEPFMSFDPEAHGHDGPIHTSFNNWRIALENDWIRACESVSGLTTRPTSPWGGDHIGFYSSHITVDRSAVPGTRSYAASAYLTPNLERKNLIVLTEAIAARITLSNQTATGVRFLYSGQSYEVRAKKEIILACGVYKSPQLLELSGIGDPTILNAAGVPCTTPLPRVGANLQNHVLSGNVYQLADGVTLLDSFRKADIMAQHMHLYEQRQAGALAAANSCIGFLPYASLVNEEKLKETIDTILRSTNASAFQEKQRLQIIEQLRNPGTTSLQFAILPGTSNLERGAEDQTRLPEPGTDSVRDGLTLVAMVQYPASRGTVHIRSPDPMDDPDIDLAYLSHPADVAVLTAGLQFCERVAQSSVLKEKIRRRICPGPGAELG